MLRSNHQLSPRPRAFAAKGCDPLWMNTGFMLFRYSIATQRVVEAFITWVRENYENANPCDAFTPAPGLMASKYDQKSVGV